MRTVCVLFGVSSSLSAVHVADFFFFQKCFLLNHELNEREVTQIKTQKKPEGEMRYTQTK